MANGMTEGEKITTATISLDGEVVAWFQWEEHLSLIQSWVEFKGRLLDRFRHTKDGTLSKQFLSLRQEGSVRDYLLMFELLATTLEDMPKHVQESGFINGLKSEIKANVRMMKP